MRVPLLDMLTMDRAIPNVSPDDEAMQRVAQGDRDALATLFDRHKTRLFGFLYHLVGERTLAEDLLGETFLRVYRARSRYRAGTGFLPWMFTIGRNLALGELRRRSVLSKAHERLSRQLAAAPEDWQPDASDLRERIQAALAELPEEQRSALVLKEYQGLSYREIAQVLECTEEAARARAYRARVTMREALRDWWEA
jgi:RNA polymerase sigma-70 factor, ECF subfamily